MTELVSVLMPAYNHGQFVEQAVSSVLNQTVRGLELVVIDDGSSDDTYERLQRIAATDGRVRLSRHTGSANRGRQETFHAAVEQSRGRWLAILSSDDVWHPTKLERQLPILERGAEFTYGQARLIDIENRPVGRNPIGADAHALTLPPFEAMLRANYIPEVTVAFTRDLYDRAGGFQSGQEFQDLALWLRFLALTEPVFLPAPLGDYRLSQGVMASTRAAGREFHAVCSAVDGLQQWPALPAELLPLVRSWYRAHAAFLPLIDRTNLTAVQALQPTDAGPFGELLARRWRRMIEMVGTEAVVEWATAIELQGPELRACVDACFDRPSRMRIRVGQLWRSGLRRDVRGMVRSGRDLANEARSPDIRR